MAQKKQTKRFEKRHLKDTLERRKDFKKIKQKHQLKTKQKARRAEERGDGLEEETANSTRTAHKFGNADKALESMSVDDFFSGGFDIPAMPRQATAGKKRKRGAHFDEDGNNEDSRGSDELASESLPVASDSGSENEEDHQEQLDKLAEQDPEFHKYLQENEPELLNAHLDDIGLSDEEGLKNSRKKQKKFTTREDDVSEDDGSESGKQELDIATVKKWSKALTEQHSLRAAKEVVVAFRVAAQSGDEEQGAQSKYSITSPKVYHLVTTTALTQIPAVFQYHLPVQEGKSGKIKVDTEAKKFKTLMPILKSHTGSILQLLGRLSDPQTLRLTLGSTLPLLPYLLSFKKLVRDIAKAASAVWSSPSNTEATRIAAFLVLRRLTVIGDPGIRANILKTTYQSLLTGSRNTTIHTIAGVNLMKNSGAELFGIDSSVGYTTAFNFIRQLAIHLRQSTTKPSKEAYKSVYNWQYVHSLDFWARVLSMHAAEEKSALRPLIYPLVQVTLGALRLIPTATYFPLRFQLIRSLLRISLASGTYIPLAPALYEVLGSVEMRKATKPATLKPLDFETCIRAPESYLRTRPYQDGVGEQVVELMSEFFVLWTKSIAFPELSLAVTVLLKRWLKDANSRVSGKGNRNAKLNGSIQLLVQKLEANAKWIEEHRVKVEFAPNDRKGVEEFLRDVEWIKSPLGAFVVSQRKMREELAKSAEEGRRAEQKKEDEARRQRHKEREAERSESEEDVEDDEVVEDEDDDDEDDEEVRVSDEIGDVESESSEE